MTVNDDSQTTPERPPPRRFGCLAILMILIGILLFLPGLCTLIVASKAPEVGNAIGGIASVLALVGVLLIWGAFSRPRH